MFKRKLNESTDANVKVIKKDPIFSSKDGTLKYDFMISLQNIATAKIITEFWMNQNTQMEIVNLFQSLIGSVRSGFTKKWLQIESNIITQVSKLKLPVSVIRKLINVVPVIGNTLLNWIRYHDEYVLKSGKSSPYSAVAFIEHTAWTARGKIDYAQTAKNILAGSAIALSDDHKYRIACTYCFVDEIRSLSFIGAEEHYLDDIDIVTDPMVHFWTAHIRRNYELYNPLRRDITGTYEHLIWLLIENNGSVKRTLNEVPIIFVWNELNREEKAQCISTLIKEIGNQDFVYYIMSSIDYKQQQKVFKECSVSILSGILNDWLWEEYFLPTALHILDIMDPLSYLNVLEEVNKGKNKNSKEENKYLHHKFKYFFKKLWEKAPRRLKDFIYEHEDGHELAHLVMVSLSWERDGDLLELILNDYTVQQRRNLVFGYHGINYCSFLIQRARWDSLELFIKHTLSYEDDVSQLKQIFSNKAERMALHFLNRGELQEIENFMMWSFKSEEERGAFRRSLAYTKMCPALESVISNNNADFRELEKHFKWCAKNDPELIIEFRAQVLKCPTGEALISKLLEQYKYELFDKVLSWCLSENQKKIAHYKSNLYKDSRFIETIRSLMCILREKDNSFKLLDTFITWKFTNEKEIREYKKWLLYPLRTYVGVLCSPCRNLLAKYKLKLADKFINWCVTSSEAASTFKNEYMLSNDMFFILYTLSEDGHDLKQLIDWFDPSEATVEKFKMLFFKDDCPRHFFKLLDDFIKSK